VIQITAAQVDAWEHVLTLFPVSARRQLNDLSDEMAARITIIYYVDVRDALLKAMAD